MKVLHIKPGVSGQTRSNPVKANPVIFIGLLVVSLAGSLQAADRQVILRRLPAAAKKLQPVGRLGASNSLALAIGLPLRNQPDLAKLLQRLYDPTSPDYRKYVTPQRFTEMFGPTKQDYEAVMAFARSNHLTVTGTYSNRALLDVRGTVADIEKALQITMRQYQHPTEARLFYAPDVDPTLDLQVPVLSIRGLNNYELPRPKNLRLVPDVKAQGVTPNGGSGSGGAYVGGDFRTAYLPGVSLTGTGQAVGLLEFEGYDQTDITNYEGQSGYANVTLTNVLVDGATGANDGNALKIAEVSADIEMTIAMAPGLSRVMVYEVNPASTYADDMLTQMATDNAAKQLSSSWNFGTDAVCEQDFQEFAAQGQSFLDASGDADAYSGGVPNPDDDPYITIVGGTTLTTTSGGAWSSETTWNQGGGVGSSGGISTTYAIPYWQAPVSMSLNGGSTTMRNIPDVALTANNIRIIYNNGSAGTFAGTSCAAPLWAGFMALVNEQAALNGHPYAGFINPAVYWLGQQANYSACFHDITTGNNTNSSSHNLFQAVAGYDLCTGWGTPAGSSLITALSTPDPLQLLSKANFAATGLVGGPFSPSGETITLTNLGSQTVTWAITNLPTWLTVTPTNGTLSAASSVGVSVSVNATANSLSAGNYTDSALILNQTDGFAKSCQFALQVEQALVQNGGFETGNDNGWTQTGNIGGVFITTASSYVHSGKYGLLLGPSGSLAYLSQTVPTTAGQSYLLSLWLDCPNSGTPNVFLVSWNGSTIFAETNVPAFGWTNLQFFVSATGTSSVLQFGIRDDANFFGLDDISVAPVITSTALALGSSENPSGYNDSVSFTATLPTAATGNVVFLKNGVPFSTNSISAGTALSAATTLLPRGDNPIQAGYAGDANYLGSTNNLVQVVTNHPPAATTMTVYRTAGLGLLIPFSDVATNWSDADGDPVTLASLNLLTTNGISLTTNASDISYTNSRNVNDQFSYSISDNYGGTGSGLVNIMVIASLVGQAQGISVSNGTATVFFAGLPGYGYNVERSTNLVNWLTLLSTNAPGGGLFQIMDSFGDLGSPPNFATYRLEWNP